MSDLRTSKRFALELPIDIHDQQSAARHTAISTNLSAAGVYIYSETELAVGSPITFDIKLPGQVIGADSDVEIECTGRVVRAEPEASATRGGRRGVACVIDQYRFIRKQEA
ncbi:MAG: PilZ domain-containing protein [Acidobacteriaceae bacterium]|nr:PilZ domain-containing protein [Acidobacteriaceae bacterium]